MWVSSIAAAQGLLVVVGMFDSAVGIAEVVDDVVAAAVSEAVPAGGITWLAAGGTPATASRARCIAATVLPQMLSHDQVAPQPVVVVVVVVVAAAEIVGDLNCVAEGRN